MAETIEGTATPSLTEQQARELLLRADPQLGNPTPQDIETARQTHHYISTLMRSGSQEDIVAIAGQHGLDTNGLQQAFAQINGQVGQIQQRGTQIRQQETELALKLDGAKRNSLIGSAVGLVAGGVAGYFLGKRAKAKWPTRSLPVWGARISTALAGLLGGTLIASAFSLKPLAAEAQALQQQGAQVGMDAENIGKASMAQLQHIETTLTTAVLADKLKAQQVPEQPQASKFTDTHQPRNPAEAAAQGPRSAVDHATRPPQEHQLA